MRWFQEARVPEGSELVGYARLVAELGAQAPVRQPACVSGDHVHGGVQSHGGWRRFDRRYAPGKDLHAHLAFALKHEAVDLPVLVRVLEAMPREAFTDWVASTPTGVAHRRAWFWREHLLGDRLSLPDAPKVKALPLLDPEAYVTVPGELSPRHKVRNNLLGGPGFCPILRRSPALDAWLAQGLSQEAKACQGQVSQALLTRAASFLLLADSQASFAIEGERPPANRLERWGRAVAAAGRRPLSMESLERLHALLFADDRFVQVGLRTQGVFLGERARDGSPLPEFVGAPHEALPKLMQAWFACHERMAQGGVDPVLHAAALAFGFVYVHPLQDGNGRIHRCLIHQVLAERAYTPPGMVFPVSSVMAEGLDAYRRLLQAHTGALMPFLPWQPTPEGNVRLAPEDWPLHAYFDATAEAEYLFACVAQTVRQVLPRELCHLACHDEAMRGLMAEFDLADAQAQQLILWVRQNGGRLPKRRRTGPFALLSEAEVARVEATVSEAFEALDQGPWGVRPA